MRGENRNRRPVDNSVDMWIKMVNNRNRYREQNADLHSVGGFLIYLSVAEEPKGTIQEANDHTDHDEDNDPTQRRLKDTKTCSNHEFNQIGGI